jgi:hypothetical protein
MDAAVSAEQEHILVESVRLLFPDESITPVPDPGSLSVDLLKNAYRSRVFESHPDRAVQTGCSGDDLKERFIAIESAYKYLYDYILNSRDLSVSIDPPSEFNSSTERADRLMMPDRILTTGQYLVCVGAVSINDLIEAIEWQRGQRPPFGSIAVSLCLMNEREVRTVMNNRRPGERFGQCALRHGFVNSFQFRAIIEKQMSMQNPIGSYFIFKGLISEDDLKTRLVELKRHNDRFSGINLSKTQ